MIVLALSNGQVVQLQMRVDPSSCLQNWLHIHQNLSRACKYKIRKFDTSRIVCKCIIACSIPQFLLKYSLLYPKHCAYDPAIFVETNVYRHQPVNPFAASVISKTLRVRSRNFCWNKYIPEACLTRFLFWGGYVILTKEFLRARIHVANDLPQHEAPHLRAATIAFHTCPVSSHPDRLPIPFSAGPSPIAGEPE